MSNYLAIKINNDEFKHFKVPMPVYNYVKQMETAIRRRNFDTIERLYPDRFTYKDVAARLADEMEIARDQYIVENWRSL